MTCAKLTTIAVIVNGNKHWIGTNWCANPQEICPREGMKTGEGYELCKDVCEQAAHAEIDACMKARENCKGATLYLIGHYYCCDDCKMFMEQCGIKNVVICQEKL